MLTPQNIPSTIAALRQMAARCYRVTRRSHVTRPELMLLMRQADLMLWRAGQIAATIRPNALRTPHNVNDVDHAADALGKALIGVAYKVDDLKLS